MKRTQARRSYGVEMSLSEAPVMKRELPDTLEIWRRVAEQCALVAWQNGARRHLIAAKLTAAKHQSIVSKAA